MQKSKRKKSVGKMGSFKGGKGNFWMYLKVDSRGNVSSSAEGDEKLWFIVKATKFGMYIYPSNSPTSDGPNTFGHDKLLREGISGGERKTVRPTGHFAPIRDQGNYKRDNIKAARRAYERRRGFLPSV